MKFKQCLLLIAISGLANINVSFAAPEMPEEYHSTSQQDPLEIFNRAMYHFNDIIDQVALKPAATLYNYIIPKPLAKGFSNFFANIDTIPTVINDVLQLNFRQTANDAWRLVINSTVGIAGFFDVACHIGLKPNVQDLGLTFARWGWENCTYLVIPFLGPTTIRDGIAWPINYQYMTIYPRIYPVNTRYAIYGLSLVVKRADLLHFQNVFEQASLDKYVFMRDAYLQRRHYLIERNKTGN